MMAGTADGEEALLKADLPSPPASRAGNGGTACRRPTARARLTGFEPGNLNLRPVALGRLLEGDLHIVAQIGATLGSSAA